MSIVNERVIQRATFPTRDFRAFAAEVMNSMAVAEPARNLR